MTVSLTAETSNTTDIKRHKFPKNSDYIIEIQKPKE